MEFPDLGSHCHVSICARLDFLPLKCAACSHLFCTDHIQYSTHDCTESYAKNNVVPVCPLCDKPIPVAPGESADTKVSAHIDTDCTSEPAKERRGTTYKNKCALKGCKQKELIPLRCAKCAQNFCLRHRHERDHTCPGHIVRRNIGGGSRPSANQHNKEDEALARALQNSLNMSNQPAPRVLSDLEYAKRLQEQENRTAEERRRYQQGNRREESVCVIS